MGKAVARYGFIVLIFILTIIYVYPIFQGLVLLPLDLLVSNYSPWHFASTILLKNAYMQDSILQLFPWRHLAFNSLTHGQIPFWNPYQFTGMPFMAGMKPMVWYPINLLFPLGEIASWHALLLFQLFGSMFFMYLFMRSLGLRRSASLLSGIAFAFSTLMVGVLEFGSDGNALLWLPLFLFLVKKYLDIPRGAWLLGLGLSLACVVFAGHLQYLAYEMIIVLSFLFIYGKVVHAALKQYMFLGISMILGLGVSAVQIIPSFEMFRSSYRGIESAYTVFSGDLLKPYQLLRLLAPDFFGNPLTHDLHISYIEQSGYFGIIPLFFAIYAMIVQRKNTIVRLFTVLFCLGILFSLDGVAQLLYWLRIPVITSGSGARLFFITEACGAMLAGFGISEFVHQSKDKRSIVSILIYGGFVVLTFVASLIFAKLLHVPFPVVANLKFPIIILCLFLVITILYFITRKKFSYLAGTVFVIAVVFLTYFDLFRVGYRFLTFSNTKFLYPNSDVTSFIKSHTDKTLDRVFGFIEPELPTYFGIYSVETYNPLYPERTAVLLNTLMGHPTGSLPVNKYYLSYEPNLKRTLDFLGVKYIVAPAGTFPSTVYFLTPKYMADLTRVFSNDRLDVYRNEESHQRFGLFYNVKDNLSGNSILHILGTDAVDTTSTVLLESKLPVVIHEGTGSASLIRTTLNSQEFSVNTTVPAIFYVSDAYYPGWNATVNGRGTVLYRANYNFRAVVVPQGKSTVFFSYTPTGWNESMALSIVSFVMLLGISVNVSKRKPI